jgi:transposase
MKEAIVYVGVDVAKAYLDAAYENQRRRVPNDAAGRKQLVEWLEQIDGTVQVVCEASGGYERALLEVLQKHKIKVSLVQASRVRQFARAAGIWAKTDTIDAGVLRAFGRAIQPPESVLKGAVQERLREVESQRRHLSRVLVMEQNRRAHRPLSGSLSGLASQSDPGRLLSTIARGRETTQARSHGHDAKTFAGLE